MTQLPKFFERERFCEVYVGTVRKCSIYNNYENPMGGRFVFIEPDDKSVKWLILDGFLMDLPLGAHVEICCFNGSLRLASRKSGNYVITNAQILNIEILNKRVSNFMSNVGATYEQELLIYIERIKNKSYGFTKKKGKEYLRSARNDLSILRENKKFDPERFAKLESRREEIRQLFLDMPEDEYQNKISINFTELQHEHWNIGEELITQWQEEDLDDFDDIDLT